MILSSLDLANAIKEKKVSVPEAVSSCLSAIESSMGRSPGINAFLKINPDLALSRAEEIQKKIDRGDKLSRLAGVPIAVKDNISVMGFEMSCASRMLEGFMPIYNATVIDKLEKAGLIVIGKLNMDEFGMGGSSETGAFGAVRNPWDLSRVAGGSSGGSAAAIANGDVGLTLGSDTGGSIRQPASFCGVSGIKPTYGAVSRYGLVAYASSLEQIGPLAGNIDDAAALLEIISGGDKRDATCLLQKPFDFSAGLKTGLKGLKVGLPVNYFDKGIDESVKKLVLAAAKDFEDAGAELRHFEMPLTEYMVSAYYIIASAEASSNLSRYDGVKYGYRSMASSSLNESCRKTRNEAFGLEVKRRIMLGSFVLSSGYYDAYYKKASDVRTLIKHEYKKLFEKFDIILSPVEIGRAHV